MNFSPPQTASTPLKYTYSLRYKQPPSPTNTSKFAYVEWYCRLALSKQPPNTAPTIRSMYRERSSIHSLSVQPQKYLRKTRRKWTEKDSYAPPEFNSSRALLYKLQKPMQGQEQQKGKWDWMVQQVYILHAAATCSLHCYRESSFSCSLRFSGEAKGDQIVLCTKRTPWWGWWGRGTVTAVTWEKNR